MQYEQLSMPVQVFVDAVKMATTPCEKGQEGHPAVKRITDWWNATATPDLQCAYGFALYVRHGDNWLSGNPEEGLVMADIWARHARPSAEATLLDGNIAFTFVKQSVDENDHAYEAKAVNGMEGFSGGKWPEITGNGILTYDAHEALSLIPTRFPEIWHKACTMVLPPPAA